LFPTCQFPTCQFLASIWVLCYPTLTPTKGYQILRQFRLVNIYYLDVYSFLVRASDSSIFSLYQIVRRFRLVNIYYFDVYSFLVCVSDLSIFSLYQSLRRFSMIPTCEILLLRRVYGTYINIYNIYIIFGYTRGITFLLTCKYNLVTATELASILAVTVTSNTSATNQYLVPPKVTEQ
jgi:hypothetical protein